MMSNSHLVLGPKLVGERRQAIGAPRHQRHAVPL